MILLKILLAIIIAASVAKLAYTAKGPRLIITAHAFAGKPTCDDRCYGEDDSNAQAVRKNKFCGAMKRHEWIGSMKGLTARGKVSSSWRQIHGFNGSITFALG